MFSFSFDKFFPQEPKKEELSFGGLMHRIFVDDWVMKVVALSITLALWFGVAGLRTPTSERLKNITLRLRVSNEMEITKSPVEEVDLVVWGDSAKIDQVNRDELEVSLNLGEVQPGDMMVDLLPGNVSVKGLPTGVKVEEIQPGRISVRIERVENREVPVRPQTAENLPADHEIYGITTIPAKVPVRGPASYINSLDYISTEQVDLAGKTSDFTAQQVPLNVSNPKLTVVDQTAVDVFVRIGEKRIERLFIVPVENMAENRTATVVFYGPKSVLNSIGKEDIEIEMSSSGSNAGKLRVGLPAGIQDKVERRVLRLNGKD